MKGKVREGEREKKKRSKLNKFLSISSKHAHTQYMKVLPNTGPIHASESGAGL